MGSVLEAMTAFATLLGLGSTVTDVRDNVLIISMFFFNLDFFRSNRMQ